MNTITLPMGIHPDPPLRTLNLIRGAEYSLRFEMDIPRSISGWAMSFLVYTKLGGSSSVSRTVGSGVTLTDTGCGVATVTLAAATTSGLTVSSGLSTGEGYVWELQRTDSGFKTVLARGELVLHREVA